MINSLSTVNTSKSLSLGKLSKESRVGFDIGDTIVHMQYGTRRTPIKDAFETIRKIIAVIGSENAFIISKVDMPEGELRSRRWLKENNFHKATGLPDTNLHYCSERYYKGGIARQLKLTHFIDNRPEVSFHLRNIVAHRIIFNPLDHEMHRWEKDLGQIMLVANWKEIEFALLGTH